MSDLPQEPIAICVVVVSPSIALSPIQIFGYFLRRCDNNCESKATIKDFLKNFLRLREKALETIPARIESIFSTLCSKGEVEKNSRLIPSLAT